MKGRIWLVSAIAATAILGLAGGASASNGSSWDDPSGDSGPVADLTKIVVTSDDSGTIKFELTYGNRTALGPDDRIQIYLDTDGNQSTGNQGYDYGIGLVSGDAVLKRGTASGFEETSHATFSASADGRTVTVNRSELGGTSRFLFFVRSDSLVASESAEDVAPDASDRVFVYWVVGPRPEKILAIFAPKFPKAGTAFSAVVPFVQLEDGGTVPPEKLGCKATLNGKPLTGKASLRPVARCRWKLPRSTKGKTLSITITVTQNGATSAFAWRFKVR
jgi:hypothetical protein